MYAAHEGQRLPVVRDIETVPKYQVIGVLLWQAVAARFESLAAVARPHDA